MNKGLIGIFFALVTMSVPVCADDTRVLATDAFVRSAYEQLDSKILTKQPILSAGSNILIDGDVISAIDTNTTYDTGDASTSGLTKLYGNVGTAVDGTMTQNALTTALANKQDKLVMAAFPTSGKYTVFYDADIGQFVFELSQASLQCGAGKYNIGIGQCVDAGKKGQNPGYSSIDLVWWIDFEYGRILGDSTCLSATEGLGRTDTSGSYYGTGDYGNTFIEVEKNLSGTDSLDQERRYCWCKMTSPSLSRWVFAIDERNSTDCATKCLSDCGSRMKDDNKLRIGVYSSVDR